MSTLSTYVAKTMAGFEELLAQELTDLGAQQIQLLNRAVSFEADLKTLYKANLWARTALRILKPFKEFTAHNEQVLYKRIRRIDWTALINLEDTFSINASAHSEIFNHSQYLALKVKDAIVDQSREMRDGLRPSIDTRHADFVIDVHCLDTHFTISLDSSGESLHRRGYRQSSRAAPLNETLAAGMIILTGWDGETAFYDPMCGSGTLLTEAYLIARRIPPRYGWSHFGFMNWPDYDPALWKEVLEEAKSLTRDLSVSIIGGEKDKAQHLETQQLIHELGWKDIQLRCSDFMNSDPPVESGLIIMNPPYGERLDQGSDMEAMYKNIGDTFKQNYKGWTAWILSGNVSAMKRVGLRTSKKLHLTNGSIPCRYHKYEMY